MASGWAKDGAVQDQIDASVEDAVRRARSALQSGEGALECDECGAEIPAARRAAVPAARRCVACQEQYDASHAAHDPINRRGSKDSQLR